MSQQAAIDTDEIIKQFNVLRLQPKDILLWRVEPTHYMTESDILKQARIIVDKISKIVGFEVSIFVLMAGELTVIGKSQ